MQTAVADEQIVAATAASVSWQATDQHGDPGSPGTVSVVVTRADGTVQAVAASPEVSGSNPVTLALTASEVGAEPDRLSVVWSGLSASGSTVVEVVGRTLLTQAEYLDREPKSTSDLSPAKFRRARREVDALFRRVCHRSFVPRLDVVTVNQDRVSQRLFLPTPNLREVVWAVDENGTAVAGATGVAADDAGIAYLANGCWPCGRVTVGYRHGMDRPPDDVLGAAALAVRDRMNAGSSGIPTRALTEINDLGAFRLATPGVGGFTTGLPEVDEVLNGYRFAAMVA